MVQALEGELAGPCKNDRDDTEGGKSSDSAAIEDLSQDTSDTDGAEPDHTANDRFAPRKIDPIVNKSSAADVSTGQKASRGRLPGGGGKRSSMFQMAAINVDMDDDDTPERDSPAMFSSPGAAASSLLALAKLNDPSPSTNMPSMSTCRNDLARSR